jgi:hypothetical protein
VARYSILASVLLACFKLPTTRSLSAVLSSLSMIEQQKSVSDRSTGRAFLPASTLKNRAPRPRPAQQGQSDALTEVVELLVDEGCLDAVGLASLGSCSRAHRIAAEALLKTRTMYLLLTTVQQAAAIEQSTNITSQQKSAQAVDKLLKGRHLNSSCLTGPNSSSTSAMCCRGW